jgi:hypothetical protein
LGSDSWKAFQQAPCSRHCGCAGQQTYESRLSKLREDLAPADLQRSEANVEQLDIEVAFAVHVLSHSSPLWSNANPADSRALQ